jgi:hypothetical protein
MDVTQQIDARIAKLQQVRELLKDPEVFALVKAIVTNGAVTNGAAPSDKKASKSGKRPPHRRWRGSMATTAYECVQDMEGRFTRQDLVKELKAAGYEFIGRNPLMSMQRTLEKLLHDKIIRIVTPGAGRRPTLYERND